MRFICLFALACLLFSCEGDQKKPLADTLNKDSLPVRKDTIAVRDSITKADSVPKDVVSELEQQLMNEGLVNIQVVDSTIRVQLRYSSTDNFLGMDVYGDLEHCYLQPDVAGKLAMAQKKLREKHPEYSLLVFDGVRPLHIQRIMWDTINVPVAERTKYLSNPDPKKGSLHNYGAAVDLTICRADGTPIDMGTDFDFFGELAYPSKELVLLDSGKITQTQINNRKLLRSVMYGSGFFGIQTEWWHFNSLTRDSASKIYRMVE